MARAPLAAAALALAGLALASDHDAVQAGAPVHTSAQCYLPRDPGRRLLAVGGLAEPDNSCSSVRGAAEEAQPIRIGYELVDAEGVDGRLREFVENTLMARATAYWSSVLGVHRAAEPLRAERQGLHCSRFPFDTEDHCTASEPPSCGTTGLRIPDKYLKAKRTCKERCSPAFSCQGDCYLETVQCACNVEDWAEQRGDYCCQIQADAGGPHCPASCTADSATFVGSGTTGGLVCEDQCVEEPEGEGAKDEDLHIFVTIQDKDPCSPKSDLQAYASWCVKDQCDRPIFASINFCASKLSLDHDKVDAQVSSVVHELAHAMAFSSSLFKYFRHEDGTPRLERDPADQDAFPGEVRWSCGGGKYAFPDPNGNRLYSDLSPAILSPASERGFEQCQCPIGRAAMGDGCLAGLGGFRVPSCVVRVATPTVLREVRRHFACDSLGGAELENQDTDECAIVGSHWEQRIFNGEVMAAVGGGMAPYLSRVTLALFQDSGWYQVNFSKADALTKGVHWGYQQGCSFATEKCISDGAPLWDRAYCTSAEETSCSLDRTRAMGCEMANFDREPPSVFNYLGRSEAGSLPEMDYCPTYRVRLTNRVCTDESVSSPAPYTNINIMREVFGSSSRCLMGSLRKAIQANFFQTYYYKQEDFSRPMPACYEVECAADRASYAVKASMEPGPGSRELGTCWNSGQELTADGFEGSVTCAAPEEICQVQPANHVSARPPPAQERSTDAAQLLYQ